MANPERIELNKLAEHFSSRVDIFICSASYESRSLSVPLSLLPGSIGRALICANEDFIDHLSGNLNRILQHFGAIGQKVELRQDNPISGLDGLHLALLQSRSQVPQRILLDVTTFTREGLLIVIRLLAQLMKSNDTLELIYAPASSYDKDWLSRGLGEIRSVLGYPGRMTPSRKLHLVVLVGFEAERARLLIDACEPDVISLGRGHDATSKEHLPINADTLRQLCVHYPQFNEFSFSSVDVEATAHALATQIDLFPHYNTVIAPMNTKLSTVGTALYALTHTDVQLCYAPALTYNFATYSKPSDHCYIFKCALPHLGEPQA